MGKITTDGTSLFREEWERPKYHAGRHPGYVTYLNYLRGIALYLRDEAESQEELLEKVAESTQALATSGSKHFTSVDPSSCRIFLFKAWNTEAYTYNSLMSHQGPSGTGAVLWAFVQMWYSITWSATPVFLSVFNRIPDNHQGMVRSLRELAVTRKLLPAPWNCSCSGDPKSAVFFPHNELVASEAANINTLNPPTRETACDYVRSFMLSTNRRKLDKKRENWLADNKSAKRFPPSERQSAIGKIGPTSLFDALYRLRDKSNYKDNDSFLWDMGRQNPSQEFMEPISVIFQSLMMHFEVLMTGAIGKESLDDLVAQFISWSGNEHAKYVEARARMRPNN